ncbi:hypothetical protein QE152_g6499 [Popillia japonica]|uniref:Transposase Tc1-like domain-containing protein n=1 Tax=Popillia japonica TaxID=7064 RepID=A0AAW1MKH6_POPJA
MEKERRKTRQKREPRRIANGLKWKKKGEKPGKKENQEERGQTHRAICKKEPFTTSGQIKDYLHLTISTVTVRRRLAETNLHGRRSRKTP